MSETDQNKTEQATSYKLEQAKKKGMVARSQELGIVVSLVFASGYISMRGDNLISELYAMSARALAEAGSIGTDGRALTVWLGSLMSDAASLVTPLIATALVGAVLGSIVQTGVIFAPGAFKVDVAKLNPSQGLKRIFSMQLLLDAGKALFKMTIYVGLSTVFIWKVASSVSHTDLAVRDVMGTMRSYGMDLVILFLLTAGVFAAIDQVIVRRMFARKMRMSKHEQKQETKQLEGDPRIKNRRKQLQRELLKRARSMRNIRGADVLITNPTHYAVALRYEPSTMSAPTVVAMGAGDFAVRLKKLAFVYAVPIIESRAIARKLYHNSLLDQEVNGNLYQDTASIYLKIRRLKAEVCSA